MDRRIKEARKESKELTLRPAKRDREGPRSLRPRTKATDAKRKRDAPPTILVLDDDASVRSGLMRLLRALGFLVEGFERPSALLARELPSRNACLIVDINLPEMNGVELCERLAQAGCKLPSIIITGHSDVETQRLAREAQAVAVFIKPVHEQPLLDAIARAVELSNS